MISGIYSALSGLFSFGRKMESVSDNIANSNTENFKKTRVTLEEQRPQGVKPVVEKVGTPGPVVMKEGEQGMVEVEMSNVDVGEELVEMISSQRNYEASLNAFKTLDETKKSVIDLKT